MVIFWVLIKTSVGFFLQTMKHRYIDMDGQTDRYTYTHIQPVDLRQ